MSVKLYPVGIQNFEKIRREGYFYVDKTGSYCFLSRVHQFVVISNYIRIDDCIVLNIQ